MAEETAHFKAAGRQDREKGKGWSPQSPSKACQ